MAERNDNKGNPQGGAQDKGSASTNMGADKSGKAQGLTDHRQPGATKPDITGGQGTKQGGDKSRNDSDQGRTSSTRENRNAGTDAALDTDDAAEATTDTDTQGGPDEAGRTTAQREDDRKDDSTTGRRGTSNDRGLH